MIGANVGGLDPTCTATDGGPSAVSGPIVDEGDRIRLHLQLRLGFGKVSERVWLESGEGVKLLCRCA